MGPAIPGRSPISVDKRVRTDNPCPRLSRGDFTGGERHLPPFAPPPRAEPGFSTMFVSESCGRRKHPTRFRIAMYSHDTFGLGHLTRTLRIARTAVETIPGA